MSWCQRTETGYTLAIHAQPGAKRSEVVGLHGDRLKLRIAAPPLAGKANAALIAFLAQQLDLPRSKLLLLKGESAREKIVAILDPQAQPEKLLKNEAA